MGRRSAEAAPRRVRVVFEPDGKLYFSDEDGAASPARYAATVCEDRQLRLAGKEVHRFGGQEFFEDHDPASMLRTFYSQLLARHGVIHADELTQAGVAITLRGGVDPADEAARRQ